MVSGQYVDAHRWQAARSEWADDMARGGMADSTRERRDRHLRKFAAEVGRGPYEVDAQDVRDWEQRQTWGTNTGYAYRVSLRSFYAWAVRVGRVASNPLTEQGHPLARRVPGGWFGALAEYRLWLRSRGLSTNTAGLHRSHLLRLARQSGAPTPWAITDTDLTRWLARQQWARETLRAARAAVRSFYEWAELRGYVDASPAADLAKVRTMPALARPASEDAYAHALSRADARTRLMLRLAAEVGLRRAEVAGLHTRDLVSDGATIWLEVHDKGDRPRLVPLVDDLAHDMISAPAGWLFPNLTGGHLSAAHVGRLVSAALPEGVSMHQLRHRFATLAYGSTRDLFAVQRLLGHSSPTTTQRYVATTPDDLRHVATLVNAARPKALR